MVGARWVYGGLLIIQQLVVRCQRSFSSFDGRPYIQITFLSLDGANHDALDEVFLEHRVDEEDRDGGHHHREGSAGRPEVMELTLFEIRISLSTSCSGYLGRARR